MEDIITNHKNINQIVREYFDPTKEYGTISSRTIELISDTRISTIINESPQWRECIFSQIGIYSVLYENQVSTKYKIDIKENNNA